MNTKAIQYTAWGLLIFGGLITLYLIIITLFNKYWIWGDRGIDFAVTGQFGDFIGGFAGTFFTLSGTLLIFLSFQEQTKQNRQEYSRIQKEILHNNKSEFETTFFEMIRLHRENVSELNYTKFEYNKRTEYNPEKMSTAHGRKVFRVVFEEFTECYKEIKKYSRFLKEEDIAKKKYITKLNEIRNKINPRIDIKEMSIIDIAYSIIYYGINSEGETILRNNFKNKYNGTYIFRLLSYLKLKPKKENIDFYNDWEEIRTLETKELVRFIEEIYDNRIDIKSLKYTPSKPFKILTTNHYQKYYGGHQHRLGHYFRHLFQSYKYLNSSLDLSSESKYFYGKTFRAQLSTYEQALLFINSISTLGMKWELTPETDENLNQNQAKRFDLITTYHLIKNLPGTHLNSISYKTYYPKVKYETDEQI